MRIVGRVDKLGKSFIDVVVSNGNVDGRLVLQLNDQLLEVDYVLELERRLRLPCRHWRS